MKILVTGSAGFIGRHLVSHLIRDGHDVTGVDLLGHPRTDIRYWFRTDRSAIGSWDLVIHCAAVVGGRALIENSPLLYARNLEIDAKLFQWAEWAKPGRIVYVSSVAAYPVYLQHGAYMMPSLTGTITDYEMPAHILHEDDLGDQPDQLYGWAKLTGEMLASKSSVPVSIPRPFTVYGEDQDPVFPFANLAKHIRERCDPVTVWGSGNQVRDFIHVDDVAAGMIAMAEQGIDGPVNFCTGTGTSLNELITMMTDAAGYSPAIEHLDKTEGLLYRVGNPKKLHEFYTPKISLEEGVRRAL